MTKYFRSIIRHFVVWTFAFIFWSILRQYGQELVSEPDIALLDLMLLHVTLGIMAGIILGTVEYYLIQSVIRKYSFGITLIVESLAYLLVFILLITTGVSLFSVWQNQEVSLMLIKGFLLSNENLLLIFYCYLVAFTLNFIKQIDKKFKINSICIFLKINLYPQKYSEYKS